MFTVEVNPSWSKNVWDLSLSEFWAQLTETAIWAADWFVNAPMWKVGLTLLAIGIFFALGVWSDDWERRKKLVADAEREKQKKEQHKAAHDYYKNKYK